MAIFSKGMEEDTERERGKVTECVCVCAGGGGAGAQNFKTLPSFQHQMLDQD